MISLIAAVDENYGLGYNNQLLCHLPADLKFFKHITTGKPIIMGRLTYESIGRPLPNRHNIVVSRHVTDIEGVTTASNLEQAIEYGGDGQEIMIIGGATIYKQAIHMAQQLYITKIHHQFVADVFFPEISESEWKLVSEITHPVDEKNKYPMTFQLYQRT